jgi:hypothetical protein
LKFIARRRSRGQAVGVKEQRPVGADELDLAVGGEPRATAALA